MAFRNKQQRLVDAGVDILVIPECENPQTKGDWDAFTEWAWIGDNDNKGLGVFTRNGIAIDSVTEIDECRYAVAVATDAMDILGIWAMNDTETPRQRYIGQVWTALQHYPGTIDAQTAVLGDFNWNVIWDDSPKHPLCGDFSETVAELRRHGLHSVYHHVTGEAFGDESAPTLFMHKKEDRPYYVDYAFLPEPLLDSVSLTVGDYDDWIAASDHMPLLVDIAE